ncbi:MAG: GlsB/YeaQ/YmgE family stress response membrane protein [Candidatus Saccharimonadales bacterium]
MNLIITLLVGGVIGWLAAAVAGRHEGLFASILIGVVGAFIGSFLANLLGSGTGSYMTFTWPGLFWAFLGSLVLVIIMNVIQGSRGSRSS